MQWEEFHVDLAVYKHYILGAQHIDYISHQRSCVNSVLSPLASLVTVTQFFLFFLRYSPGDSLWTKRSLTVHHASSLWRGTHRLQRERRPHSYAQGSHRRQRTSCQCEYIEVFKYKSASRY